MSSMNDHMLDNDKLEKGVKMPLFNRDGGISDDYIMVRWAWTDEVRATLNTMQGTLSEKLLKVAPSMGMNAKETHEAERKAAALTAESVLDTQCVLISSWSFSEKPTKSNVKKFLKSRPDIAERIDRASARTKSFFTKGGGSS